MVRRSGSSALLHAGTSSTIMPPCVYYEVYSTSKDLYASGYEVLLAVVASHAVIIRL